MPQGIIFIPEEIDVEIVHLAKEWKLSKHETIIRIIRKYLENNK